MKSLYQDIKISLIQSPSRVANIKPFDCGNYFAFDGPSPTSLDYPEERGPKAEVGYAPYLARPVR